MSSLPSTQPGHRAGPAALLRTGDEASGADPQPSREELLSVFGLKYGYPDPSGPNPRLWLRHGYFTPSDWYEAVVAKLVGRETRWLDVGCGRDVFPDNRPLADILAKRCALLAGLDPDANVEENPWVHERVRCTLGQYEPQQRFDLVTLRMVAEHLADAEGAVAALGRLTRPGGKVVLFTVHKWSPAALLARLVPFRLHHAAKRAVWNTEERDTFPVAYRMNTHGRLTRLFTGNGFTESYFAYLAACCVFWRFPALHRLELALWRALRLARLPYPQGCLLAVYERRRD